MCLFLYINVYVSSYECALYKSKLIVLYVEQ